MILEFEENSPELKEFKSQIKYIDSVPFTFEGDSDYYTERRVYKHKDGTLYVVECNKEGFCFYHRNFKKSEPYVVNFHEVRQIQRTITDYEEVN